MSDYTKESVSNLLFEKVDAILIVDAQKDNYHSIKKSGLFVTFRVFIRSYYVRK